MRSQRKDSSSGDDDPVIIYENLLKNDVPECTICLDEMSEDDVRLKPCKHQFHRKCIQTWLNQSNECPVCRKKNPKIPKIIEVITIKDEVTPAKHGHYTRSQSTAVTTGHK